MGDSYDNALAETISNRRLLDPLGYVPPAEFEAAYYQQQRQAMAA